MSASTDRLFLWEELEYVDIFVWLSLTVFEAYLFSSNFLMKKHIFMSSTSGFWMYLKCRELRMQKRLSCIQKLGRKLYLRELSWKYRTLITVLWICLNKSWLLIHCVLNQFSCHEGWYHEVILQLGLSFFSYSFLKFLLSPLF